MDHELVRCRLDKHYMLRGAQIIHDDKRYICFERARTDLYSKENPAEVERNVSFCGLGVLHGNLHRLVTIPDRLR